MYLLKIKIKKLPIPLPGVLTGENIVIHAPSKFNKSAIDIAKY